MRSLVEAVAETSTGQLAVNRGFSGFFHNGMTIANPLCTLARHLLPCLTTALLHATGALVAGFMGFLIAQIAKVFT